MFGFKKTIKPVKPETTVADLMAVTNVFLAQYTANQQSR